MWNLFASSTSSWAKPLPPADANPERQKLLYSIAPRIPPGRSTGWVVQRHHLSRSLESRGLIWQSSCQRLLFL